MEGDVRISIDYERFESDAAWDGIKAYVTNSKLPPKKIVANYHNLWFIERAFRMNKTDLRIRPIYHRLRNRIEGHICICFTAYTIMLELERRLKEANSRSSKSLISIPFFLMKRGIRRAERRESMNFPPNFENQGRRKGLINALVSAWP